MESEISKVLPSEGGKVLILDTLEKGTVHKISLEDKRAIIRTNEGQDKSVKLEDLCKLN